MADSVEVTARTQIYTAARSAADAIKALADGVATIPGCTCDAEDAVITYTEAHEHFNDYAVELQVTIAVDRQRAWERAGGDLMDDYSELLSAAEDIAIDRLSQACLHGMSFDRSSVAAAN